ncbi:MAG TPA: LPS-assembly protein LptD [Xanthobacteraceae bacterium]|jgi:LPS-assembly protein|nr:LPS-assembly protein LptD [Xanthobacteraceae bacterium]
MGAFAPIFSLSLMLACCLDLHSAGAQAPLSGTNLNWVGVPKNSSSTVTGLSDRKVDQNAQMLVRADELHYDYTNSRVLAVGNVQMYYGGSTLEAAKLVYDQKTKRLRAEGNVRLIEADGKTVYGEILDLTDDFRDGFVDSLRLEAPDKTRFAAPRVERSPGKPTVMQSGVYTACEPCKEDPRKPPAWQIKAARIIHDEAEKMIYFENARLEAFGIPLFWAPYMSAPDPSVKRKTGFLLPTPSHSGSYGTGLAVPYYWALAPSYDLTVTPTFTTKQGVLMQGEWRQRTETGAFSIRGAGILQADPGAFAPENGVTQPGNRVARGSVDTSGQFALNDRWVWGWDALLLSDKTFWQNYNINSYWTNFNNFKSFGNGISDAGTSQLYLAGRGDRSYFDARVMHTYGLSLSDNQEQLPVVHPVIDYSNTIAQPIAGGELSYRTNLTSLSRETAEFDAISKTAFDSNICSPLTADPAVKIPSSCLLRGIPGTYTRASAEATWKRTFVDPIGQTFTPFVIMRADIAEASIHSQPGVSNYIFTGDQNLNRAMPAVGVEYRYPFISTQSWGTQTIEPIAQVIARPNEPNIQRTPNEDAQSLIFGDDNLFRVNKFSGWDRVEGGTRANYGVQYTAQFNRAGNVNVLFGQSYQLTGQNSFAVADTANTGLDSGLQTRQSDYVGRVSYQPDSTYMFTSRFRFDQQTFAVQRAELEGKATFDRWTLSMMYGNYASQPNIGFLTRRDGILGGASVKITPNWAVMGSARYDIGSSQFDQYRVGLGYIDDCFAISVSYITDYAYGYSSITNTSVTSGIEHAVMLQIALRTIGGSSFSQHVGSNNTN